MSRTPRWLKRVMDCVSGAVKFKGPGGGFESRTMKPGNPDNKWKHAWYLAICPQLMELVEPGPNDGTEVYPVIENIDIMLLTSAYDVVDHVHYHECDCGARCFVVLGEIRGKKLALEFYDRPFSDAVASLGVKDGKIFEKKPQED